MRQIKYVLLASSLLTMLLVFAVPYLDLGEGMSFTLWKLHEIIPHAYVILVATAIPALFGLLALKQNRLPRWRSIVSILCFACALFMAWAVFAKSHVDIHAAGLGAKLMVVTLAGGALASIVGIVKPERAVA